MKYNRQPYRGADTTGQRTISWFDEKVWPVWNLEANTFNRVLDVGCGNGRFLSYLTGVSKSVIAIDPIESLHPDYEDQQVEFHRIHFHEFASPEKFDALFFLGSLMILQRQGLCDILGKCKELLAGGGRIFIFIEPSEIHFVTDVFPLHECACIEDPATAVVEAFCE